MLVELDLHRKVFALLAEALVPLDGADSLPVEELAQSQAVLLGRLQAVEIEMVERQAAAVVGHHEREARAAHALGIAAEPLCQAADENRLPGPERAGQADDVAGPHQLAEV